MPPAPRCRLITIPISLEYGVTGVPAGQHLADEGDFHLQGCVRRYAR